MRALLQRLDVDPLQWRVLTKAFLRVDFPDISGGKPVGRARAGLSMTMLILIVYGATGIMPAVIAFQSRDPLLTGAALSATVGLMVAATLLMGEGSSIVSPSDHAIIGFRPVTSRTYLAVRITALMVRTIVVAAVVSGLAVIVLVAKGRPALAVAAFMSAQLTGVTATLAIVAIYGWVLRAAGPERTARYTGYMQLGANTLALGGFMFVTQDFAGRIVRGMSLAATSWWIALPPAWFGSYLLLAAGSVTWLSVLATVLSLASVLGLGWVIRDKLSMEYTEQLSRLASVTTQSAPARREWLKALNDETRAVAILVRSQLEHDIKFRLSLLSMVPITFVYMFSSGWPSDPFVYGARGFGGNPGLIQMALLFIPMSLRQTIVSSENYRASWVFHVTPADRGRLVLSARNVITGFFLLPYLSCLAALFAWSFGSASHALLHAFYLGLLSWTVLQFIIMMTPQLPFSLPHGKDTNAAMAIVRMFVAMAIGMASYFALVALVYGHTRRMIAAAAAFVLVGLLMDWATRVRVRRRRVEQMTAD